MPNRKGDRRPIVTDKAKYGRASNEDKDNK